GCTPAASCAAKSGIRSAAPATWPARSLAWASAAAARATSARSGAACRRGWGRRPPGPPAPTPSRPRPPHPPRARDALVPGDELSALLYDLERGLADELPGLARDGGFVASGFRPELDEARALRDDSRKVVVALEARVQAETGMPLKVKHNAVLG